MSWAAHEPRPHRLSGRPPIWLSLPPLWLSIPRIPHFLHVPASPQHGVRITAREAAVILPDAPMAGVGGASGPTGANMAENFPAVDLSSDAQNHRHLLGANVRGGPLDQLMASLFILAIAGGRLICTVHSHQTVHHANMTNRTLCHCSLGGTLICPFQ
jgi:hypothetical protein